MKCFIRVILRTFKQHIAPNTKLFPIILYGPGLDLIQMGRVATAGLNPIHYTYSLWCGDYTTPRYIHQVT
jgi:hypothetical protein